MSAWSISPAGDPAHLPRTDMLSVDEALSRILAAFKPLPAEHVGLNEVLGRVLAEDVTAHRTQPPVDVSAMDGYAVRYVDVSSPPTTLSVIGESAAGTSCSSRVEAGQAVRIFTGAQVPDGADAIVIQEDTERSGDHVTIRASTKHGRYIRRAGIDFCDGDIALRAGQYLDERDIAVCAAVNVPWLKVSQRPRIAILSTGNELMMPGEPLAPDQIINANAFLLEGFIRKMGGEPANLGISRDETRALDAAIGSTVGADLLVTIGGASVGDHDLVRPVLEHAGFHIVLHNVAMRPGKPVMFAHNEAQTVLSLPGNPVSVGVTAHVFLKPIINALLGRTPILQPVEMAHLGQDTPPNGPRQHYMRASLSSGPDGKPVAIPFDNQDSALLGLYATADALIVLPPHAPPSSAGDRVEILRLK